MNSIIDSSASLLIVTIRRFSFIRSEQVDNDPHSRKFHGKHGAVVIVKLQSSRLTGYDVHHGTRKEHMRLSTTTHTGES